MKPYFFAYSNLCSDASAETILDETGAVATWVRPFPHAAILLSDLALRDLSVVLHSRLGETWFLLSELSQDIADGWLPKNLWSFVNHQPGAAAPVLPVAPAPAPMDLAGAFLSRHQTASS